MNTDMTTRYRTLTITKTLFIDVGILVVSFLFVFGFASAANFADPASTPPAGNVAVPLNVGSSDQTKLGDFWASSIGSNNGYCIGESCITDWPSGSAGSTCHLETKKVTEQDPQSSTVVGSGCTVSASDTAAGWIVGSWDHCSGVSDRDCYGPKYCTFTRLVCTGAVIIAPGVISR